MSGVPLNPVALPVTLPVTLPEKLVDVVTPVTTIPFGFACTLIFPPLSFSDVESTEIPLNELPSPKNEVH